MKTEVVHRASMVSRLLIAALLAVPASVFAQHLEGDPVTGRRTAVTLCATCHLVDGPGNADGPPSFVDVAKMPSTTALSLRVFLRSNHKEMPNLMISDSETSDLIAYILDLRRSSAPMRPQKRD